MERLCSFPHPSSFPNKRSVCCGSSGQFVFSPPPAVTAHLRRSTALSPIAKRPQSAKPQLQLPGLGMQTPFLQLVSFLGVLGFLVIRGVLLLARSASPCGAAGSAVPAPPFLPSQAVSSAPGAGSGDTGWTSPPLAAARAQRSLRYSGNHTPRASSAARAHLGTRCRRRASPWSSVTHQ